ncbi:DUF2854 domain-containing protein [Prochlorothrix hollandica]|uniref:Membrane protein n=1 Tax=Prochlorothrix hollandica PCC 9006 = CALU 1027 TaxID=317619 RepID=A0A0M2Q246_PROHO|nr:DUF2854 domain-containing protein [Prochlorothrix hollandica]KKJ01049.1 membrane protein [Prochlorothrix hollandica PCC 9006 = CALU 1027]
MAIRPSLSNLGVGIGLVLVVIGFWAYATENVSLSLPGLFYGGPLLLIGVALKAAELKPVPFSQPTSAEVLALREQQATATQTQVRTDVNRYRYGQYVHLETTLKALDLIVKNQERPELDGVREENRSGAYALVLEFSTPDTAFSKWQQKQEKMTRFFGPNIAIELSQPKAHRVELALITTTESQQQPSQGQSMAVSS